MKESTFLGVCITRNTNSLQFSVYRKSTILPVNSCCPSVHKRVVIRYFVSRLQHYPLGRIEEETQDFQKALVNNLCILDACNVMCRKRLFPKEGEQETEKYVLVT